MKMKSFAYRSSMKGVPFVLQNGLSDLGLRRNKP